MFGEVYLAIIILLFLLGSSSILYSIFLEKDETIKHESPPRKKVTKVEDVQLYYEDIEDVLELDEGLLE
jgi:hypothetical protein